MKDPVEMIEKLRIAVSIKADDLIIKGQTVGISMGMIATELGDIIKIMREQKHDDYLENKASAARRES